MICDRCGAHIADNAEYCPHCGTVYGAARQEQSPRYAPGVPGRTRVKVVRPESVGVYLLWWTVALFSNAELVCCVLSVVFAFSSGNKNRANFFRAVLLFKLIFLSLGAIAVIILALCGFPFTELLNHLDFETVRDFFSEVM